MDSRNESRCSSSAVTRLLAVVLVGTGLGVTGLLAPTDVAAEEIESSIARGGRLYDNWIKVGSGAAPLRTHPKYPTDKGKTRKANTWRCKECHGWDYKGRDGAYATGRRATGIKGITGKAGAPVDEIIAIIKDGNHGYEDSMLGPKDLRDLANFVSKGQAVMDDFIDAKTKKIKGGDPKKGAVYFETLCANCHGLEGQRITEMAAMGRSTSRNPWQALHKIQSGEAGENMLSLRAFPVQISVDILSYVVTLPHE